MTIRAGTTRARWMAGGALGLAALGALGIGVWVRSRPVDPLATARAAYARFDWAEAGRLAGDRLAELPSDRAAMRLRGRALARAESDGPALRHYAALGTEGAEAEDYYLLGSILRRRGDRGQAMVLLERARAADPDHPWTLRDLAGLYVEGGFPTSAAAVARRLASVAGWEAQGHAALGPLLLGRRDGEGAAASFREVIRLDPAGSGAATRKQLARALLIAAQPEPARETLAPVLAAGPAPEASWLLGRACLQAGDRAGAVAAARAAGGYAKDGPAVEEPAPLVGEARCATCHPAIAREQAASRHARTFARGGSDLPLPPGAVADPRLPGIAHTFQRDGTAVRVEARRGGDAYAAVVEYVLGTGHRGRTAIVRDDRGQARESRLTTYANGVGWDLTVHHPDRPPDGPRGVLGKPMVDDQVEDCLRCHVTDVRSTRERLGPVADDRGIRCERCHGPGGNHLQAVALGVADPAIAARVGDTPARRDALCADCHRAPASAPTDGRDFVRFQSPNLARSRCVTETSGALGCITCHDPHRDAETSPAFYRSICLDCHAPADDPAAAGVAILPEGRRRVPCPVNRSEGCVGCHMPSVPETIPHTAYTDHDIRVHRTTR